MLKNKTFDIILFLFVFSLLFGFVPGLFAARQDAGILREKVEYSAAALKDPFESPIVENVVDLKKNAAEVKLPVLKVQGLIWGGNFPQAIINNKVVRVDDEVDGAKIVSIEKDGLWVSFNDKQYNLSSPVAVTKSVKNPGGIK